MSLFDWMSVDVWHSHADSQAMPIEIMNPHLVLYFRVFHNSIRGAGQKKRVILVEGDP